MPAAVLTAAETVRIYIFNASVDSGAALLLMCYVYVCVYTLCASAATLSRMFCFTRLQQQISIYKYISKMQNRRRRGAGLCKVRLYLVSLVSLC